MESLGDIGLMTSFSLSSRTCEYTDYVPPAQPVRHDDQPYSCATGHSPALEIVEFFVAEQHLDHSDIHLLFEQVSGEAVTQRMQGDLLVDAGCEPSLVHGAVQLTRGQ